MPPIMTKGNPSDRPHRRLPNERLLWLIQAIEEEMGTHGLRLCLRQSGMERYIDTPPPPNRQLLVSPVEYSRLMQSVRMYFGIGARGTLRRIGREVFQRQRTAHPFRHAWWKIRFFGAPESSKTRRMLTYIANQLGYPAGRVSVTSQSGTYLLRDETGDRTHEVISDGPSCWAAEGLIEEALQWATGTGYLVREIECMAAQDQACVFRIE